MREEKKKIQTVKHHEGQLKKRSYEETQGDDTI
jgi:hypothetical protein